MSRSARAAVLLLAILLPSGARAQDIKATVLGEVRRPGAYVLPAGGKLSDLIGMAGGYADNAYLRGAALVRRSARESQKKQLEELAARLEAEGGDRPEDRARKSEAAAALRAMSPRGRIPVRLSHPRLLKGKADDLALEDGDVLAVPARPDRVVVSGAVRSPGGAILPHSGTPDYAASIAAAGGYAEGADRSRVYLLAADGTAVLLRRGWIRWNPAKSRWEIPAFSSPPEPIEPGDTIVVPRVPENWAKGIRDLPEILLRISVLAGAPVETP